jgi:hypothetical protein
MKMDFSRFKKISSDEKSTTLKHPEGHKIIVAHHALSPAMRKQIKAIPTKYADGGEVDGGESTPENYGPVVPTPTLMDRANGLLSLPGEADQMALKQWQSGLSPVAPQVPVQGTPVLAAAPQVPNPMIAQAQLAPNGLVGDLASLRSAAMRAGGAGEEQGKQQAIAAEEQQNLLRLQNQEYQKKYADLDAEFKGVIHDVQQDHINPNHYMESMGSGKRVSTAIGLILGGMGAGLTGGENMAQKFLQQQIDRDIESQKANLGKKETLLSANLKRFGNLNEATQITQAMQMGIYSAKLKEAESKAVGPEAKLNALKAATDLDIRAQEILQRQAANQATMGMLSNPNASPLTKIQALPKELHDNAIKELYSYGQIQNNLKQVAPILRDAFKNTEMGENLASPLQAKKRREVAYAQLFPIVKSIAGEKMTENDAKTLIGPYLAGFSTNKKTNEENIRKLESQLVGIANSQTPILSQYGIIQPLAASPEVKTMGGVRYQKVPGGWKKVQ